MNKNLDLKTLRLMSAGLQNIEKAVPNLGTFLIKKSSTKVVLSDNCIKMLSLRQKPEDNVFDFKDAVITKDYSFSDKNNHILNIKLKIHSNIIKLTVLYSDYDNDGFALGMLLKNDSGFSFNLNGNNQHRTDIFLNKQLFIETVENEEQKRNQRAAVLCINISDAVDTISDFFDIYVNGIYDVYKDDVFVTGNSLTSVFIAIFGFENTEEIEREIARYNSIYPEFSAINSIGCCIDDEPFQQRMTHSFYALTSGGNEKFQKYDKNLMEKRAVEYTMSQKLSKLISENLFTYHYQPIVSAKDGSIIAYEALMRTDEEIGMNPLEILKYAKMNNQLYDIERATFFNCLKNLSENQNYFKDKKMFVNAIADHLLSEKDFKELLVIYGELFEKVVVEVIEQSELTEYALETITDKCSRAGFTLAIDDFGTGYSNTANLLRYKPKYVKLDRSLIQDIDKNDKKQKIVRNFIEFFHMNGYYALAEGVETYNEMETMINFGTDLLQGYYISRPKPVFLEQISQKITDEINNINARGQSMEIKYLHITENSEILLEQVYKENYTDLFIECEEICIVGSAYEHNVRIHFADDINCKLTLKNVNLIKNVQGAVINLGENDNVTIVGIGKNKLNGGGIQVPQTSVLNIKRNLDIVVDEEKSAFAVGSRHDQPCGSINICENADLNIYVNGTQAIAIGGGECNFPISVENSKINIEISGVDCIGLGGLNGKNDIFCNNSDIQITANSSTVTAVGKPTGEVDIKFAKTRINTVMSGHSVCVIGSPQNAKGSIDISKSTFISKINAYEIVNIGSFSGNFDCIVGNSSVDINCEGTVAGGIGNIKGKGDVTILNSKTDINLLCSQPFPLGSAEGTLVQEP